MRKCNRCLTKKPLPAFYQNKKTGYIKTYCKQCENEVRAKKSAGKYIEIIDQKLQLQAPEVNRKKGCNGCKLIDDCRKMVEEILPCESYVVDKWGMKW